MADVCQVSVTAPTQEEASRLGRLAVESRLAACAQVSGPLTSTYWWEGAVCVADEWLCVLKTTADMVAPLTDVVRAAHSYDTPEIVVTPVVGGDEDYLTWVRIETASPGGS